MRVDNPTPLVDPLDGSTMLYRHDVSGYWVLKVSVIW